MKKSDIKKRINGLNWDEANAFINLTVQDIAKDLKIGENMAYTI